MSRLHAIAGLAAVLLAAGPAFAQPAPAHGQAGVNLQGNDSHAWMANPHMKAFYALSKATLGKGTAGIDFPAYREKSYAIFRAFGTSMGMDPAGMVDHLKLIPGQMVQIVQDDPHALDNYESFVEAMVGPE